MEKLKPCPFCGGGAEVETIRLESNDKAWRIYCPKCGATSTASKWDVVNAIIAWNKRTNGQQKSIVHGRWKAVLMTSHKSKNYGSAFWKVVDESGNIVCCYIKKEIAEFIVSCGARMDGGEEE